MVSCSKKMKCESRSLCESIGESEALKVSDICIKHLVANIDGLPAANESSLKIV